MKAPKVSVLLPTYNGAKFITKSIESVLKQSFEDLELIIIDDGSTDRVADIVKELSQKDKRIVFIQNKENLGIQKTLNKGLRAASGEYIARIDDDDWWNDSSKLVKQVDVMDSNRNIGLCGTGVIVFNESGDELFRYMPPEESKDIKKKILKKNPYAHSSVMFRGELVEGLGGYSEEKSKLHVEDYDLWLRLGAISEFSTVEDYQTSFLLKNDSVSSKNKKEQLRKNTTLIKEHGLSYPGYVKYLIFSHLRYFAFNLYFFLPKPLREDIFSFYKKS